MSTAFAPLQVAIYTTLMADAGLRTELRIAQNKPYVIFNGLAPQGVNRPYVVIGSTTENAFDLIGKSGNEGTITLTIHADSPDNPAIGKIYAHINRLLDKAILSIDGHVMVQGRTSLVLTFATADGKGMQGIVEYRSLTQSS